jgi:hypothetical protein
MYREDMFGLSVHFLDSVVSTISNASNPAAGKVSLAELEQSELDGGGGDQTPPATWQAARQLIDHSAQAARSSEAGRRRTAQDGTPAIPRAPDGLTSSPPPATDSKTDIKCACII